VRPGYLLPQNHLFAECFSFVEQSTKTPQTKKSQYRFLSIPQVGKNHHFAFFAYFCAVLRHSANASKNGGENRASEDTGQNARSGVKTT